MMTQSNTISNTIKQQQAQRILKLFAIARQRYLDAGGNPRRTPKGLKGNDYTMANTIFSSRIVHLRH
ncbi:MAG: hypothetical protein V7L29_23305 [Nostoc sp.]|uniref:hypothetical protein n=1 Tax=Nostoc sp. TaxID=1180 RepID=UPI002FF2E929